MFAKGIPGPGHEPDVFFLLILGEFAGAVNLVIALIRNFLVMNRDRWYWARNWWICFLLIGAGLVAMIILWKGPTDILPFVALAGSSIGYWTNNAQYIRLSNMVCASPCWLLFDAIIGSWGGIANEIITTASALISIYRYGWKELGAI